MMYYILLITCAMFYATNASCSSSQFTCNNGNCKPLSYKCDKYDDCGDNSDEFGCGSCYPYQFRCYNGLQCIDATLACNRVSDCIDGSDETGCTYTCPNGAVRLVGTGSNQTSGYGRVEMCYNNAWGTICGSTWSYNAATVVCSQLGFSAYPSYNSSAQYGQGTGSIFLYDLICNGYESTLLSCFYIGNVVTTYCYHYQDASVTCNGPTSQPTTPYYHYTSSSFIGIIGSVFGLLFILGVLTTIVAIVITVIRACVRRARRSLQTRVVTNAPAATTIVTTTTQNSTPQTAGFDPLKGYTGYAHPPSYSATGSTYPSTGPGYPTTGYPTTGYQAAPPPYPS